MELNHWHCVTTLLSVLITLLSLHLDFSFNEGILVAAQLKEELHAQCKYHKLKTQSRARCAMCALKSFGPDDLSSEVFSITVETFRTFSKMLHCNLP